MLIVHFSEHDLKPLIFAVTEAFHQDCGILIVYNLSYKFYSFISETIMEVVEWQLQKQNLRLMKLILFF